MANVCKSCGMPMKTKKQHGGQDERCPYCIYCTDTKGKLKSREQVRAGMIFFFMKAKNMDKKEAAKFVSSYMRKMPAWKPKKAVKKKPKKKPVKKKKK